MQYQLNAIERDASPLFYAKRVKQRRGILPSLRSV